VVACLHYSCPAVTADSLQLQAVCVLLSRAVDAIILQFLLLLSAPQYALFLLSNADVAILFCTLRRIQDRERGETAFALHRAAASNGEIGRVRQIISASELISEVDLRVGLISGIPFSMQGTGMYYCSR
jgi:hypothetical protein